MKKKGLALLIVLLMGFTCFLAACTPREFTFTMRFYEDTEGITVYKELTATNKDHSKPTDFEDDLEKEGYDFGGWYTDKYFEQDTFDTFDFENNARTVVSFYPKWIKKGSDGIVYDLLSNDTYQVSGIGSFSGTELVIPETYQGKSVSIVAAGAFENQTGITRVSLPSTLSQIRANAFKGCSGIKSMVLPSSASLKYIGDDAFAGCDNVVFYTTSSETDDNILNGWGTWNPLERPVYFENRVVYEKDGYEYVVVTNTVEQDQEGNEGDSQGNADDESGNNSSQEDVEIYISRYYGEADSVELPIEFYSHDGNLVIGENSTLHIGEYAFDDTDVAIHFPQINGQTGGIAVIDEYAFAGYKGKTIEIPSSVTSIAGNAFYDTEATFDINHLNLTRLGDYFFAGYRGAQIVVPATVTSLGQYVFADTKVPIVFEEGNALAELGVYSIAGYNGETFRVPSTVKTIDRFAFVDATCDVSLEDLTIETLARHTFINYKGSKVTLPSSLKTIENRAFYNSSNLETITIPASVTSIGNIPDSNNQIGNEVFYGCDSLTSIEVEDANTEYKSIDGVLFNSNLSRLIQYPAQKEDAQKEDTEQKKVTKYEIPAQVTEIAPYAFRNAKNLTEITLPEGLTSIGESAFENCSGLEFVLINDSVVNMGANVFRGCSSLRLALEAENIPSNWGNFNPDNCEIELGSKGIEYDEESGFEYLIVSGGVAVMSYNGSSSDLNISKYKSKDKDYNVVAIGPRAFENNEHIKNVTLADTVKTISPYAFAGSTLASITASGVTRVDAYAFAETEITSIDLPNLTELADHAFYNSKLTSANVGKVTEFADYIFAGTELTDYTVPASVTKLGNRVFEGAPLTRIVIPNTVTEIGFEILKDCSSVTYLSIGFIGDKIETTNLRLNSYLFGSAMGFDVELEVEITGDYSSEAINGTFDRQMSNSVNVTKITLPASVSKIGLEAFSGCTSLQTIEFRGTITEIGASSFRNCESLTAVDLSNVTYIGSNAFENCYTLGQITLTDKLVNQEETSGRVRYPLNVNSFANCKSLVTVALPSTITNIPQGCFSGCEGLTNITFGGSIAKIDDGAFDGCASLTDLTITLKGADSLAPYAFRGCGGRWNINADFDTIPQNSFNGFLGTSVTLSNQIKTIGAYAFQNSANLESVTASGVTAIYEYAFAECPALETYDLSRVTVLGNYIFENCISLDNIKFGNDIRNLGESGEYTPGVLPRNMFSGCSALRQINLGSGITEIGIWAFNECISLREINIDNITVIGDYAFVGCSNLKGMTLTSKITKLGGSAFRDCTKIVVNVDMTEEQAKTAWGASMNWSRGATFTFVGSDNTELYVDSNGAVYKKESDSYILSAYVGTGNFTAIDNVNGVSVIAVAENAFADLDGLTSVTLPVSITSIRDNAFAGCVDLVTITASGVVELGSGAFSGCEKLTTVTLGNITSIPAQAFENCVAPELNITIANDTDSTLSIERDAFANVVASLDSMFTNKRVDLHDYALRNYSGEQIDLKNIETIGRYVFSGATAKIIMKDDSDEIADYEFAGYKGTDIQLSSKIRKIGASAFADCTNFNITIPATVTEIGAKAFENITNEIKFASDTSILTLGNGSFSGYLGEKIDIPNTVKTLGDSVFENAKNFASLTIPATVTQIGAKAFAGCSQLASINISGYLTALGAQSFVNCAMLESITLNGSLEEIGDMTFYNCSSLTKVDLPSSITVLGESAFYGCTKLESITLPDSLATIGDEAFYLCSGLTKIDIPSHVSKIGERVFVSCLNLASINVDDSNTSYNDENGVLYNKGNTELICYPAAKKEENGSTVFTVPANVTKIHSYAFAYSDLTEVYLSEKVSEVDVSAFYGCLSLIVKCAHSTKPAGFVDDWNYCMGNNNGTDYCSVVWGYVA